MCHPIKGYAVAQLVAGSIPDGKRLTEIFLWGKGGRYVGLTLPPACADCHEMWESQPPGTLRVCTGPCRDCCTFTLTTHRQHW